MRSTYDTQARESGSAEPLFAPLLAVLMIRDSDADEIGMKKAPASATMRGLLAVVLFASVLTACSGSAELLHATAELGERVHRDQGQLVELPHGDCRREDGRGDRDRVPTRRGKRSVFQIGEHNGRARSDPVAQWPCRMAARWKLGGHRMRNPAGAASTDWRRARS